MSKATMVMPIAERISQAKWMAFHQSAGALAKLKTFDEASCGPWGSTRLLLSPKTAGFIGWLGALLTVVSLALDPFTQQAIAFPTRIAAPPAKATHVQVIHSLDAIDLVPMQGAIISSLPGPLRPSANETWTFSTTSCNYTVNANISVAATIQTLVLPAANGRPAEYASQFTQIKVRAQRPVFGLGDLIARNATWITTVLTFTTAFDGGAHGRLPLLTMEHLWLSIFACGFYFCAQAYSDLLVVNGTLQGTAPSVSLALGNVLDADGQPEMQPAGSGWAEILTPITSSSSSNNNNNSSSSAAAALFKGDATFAIGQQTINSLRGYLYLHVFNATENGGNDDFHAFPDSEAGPEALRRVSSFIDIAATFDRIAAAMSHQVRLSNGSRRAVGGALVDETYVAVRWAWLALPLAVLGLVVVLLGVTILGNGKRKTRIWKSSSIAMLVHPLHGWGKDELRFRSLAEVESFADGVRVRLEDGGGTGGCRFVRRG
ncbi:hypothetical protein B0T19DRAFT_460012 [Cercophora scortea]|uniref:Uncharacterized protein n=1 Tax=Cercophora scortea TaxID=314031 RepID=A0AAE0MCC0_9PEZI|nr:hypothetical protein B0T19DRAFT_460012 [Cercophora scortea]